MVMINAVIDPIINDGTFERARIIYLTAPIPGKGRVAYLVPMTRQALPMAVAEDVLLKAEQAGHIRFVVESVDSRTRYAKNLSCRHRAIRDAAWARIAPLVDDRTLPLMLERTSRGGLIAGRAREVKVHPGQIHRDLYRYFRGGLSKDALRPEFRSVEVGTVQPDGQRKRGRKPQGVREGERPNNPALTKTKRDAIHRIIKAGAKAGVTRKDLFHEVTDKLYSSKVVQDGLAIRYVLLPEHERITKAQFMREFRRVNVGNRITKRLVGDREWKSKATPSLRVSHAAVDGPGQLYEIDWTGTQIELVAVDHPERNIGTAIIYFVVDVWSKLITGFFITIEGASWQSASLALFNAICDNTELYRHYGIPFDPEDIVSGVPHAVRGDLGPEVTSEASSAAVAGLGFDFQNARAWTGTDKPNVESANGAFKKNLLRRLVGFRPKMRKRGRRDPRSEACLTLHDLTVIVIEEILQYNRRPLRLKSVPSTARKAGIRRTPISLWHWGLPNCTGYLRKENVNDLYVKLLPEREALITQEGLKVGHFYYTAKELVQADLFAKARFNGRGIPAKVRVDPARPWQVMMQHGDRNQYIRCERIDPEGHYDHYHHEDADIEAEQHARDAREIEAEQAQAQSDTRARQAAVMKRAKARRKAAGVKGSGGGSKRIRANRDEERRTTSVDQRDLVCPAEALAKKASSKRKGSRRRASSVKHLDEQTASDILRTLRDA